MTGDANSINPYGDAAVNGKRPQGRNDAPTQAARSWRFWGQRFVQRRLPIQTRVSTT